MILEGIKITLMEETKKIKKEYLVNENVSIFDRPNILSLFYYVIPITNVLWPIGFL